ncbi:MAG: ABC transporter substrate-binding protein [Ectothiorhodospiraceae bacterium]|nr:ABC transporter substrate-binding protein [Ectothiorhodospiraceae bacterium]
MGMLRAGAFALVSAMVSAPVWAGISDGEVRIALMTDYSGPYAESTGQGSQVAAEMAIDDFGGQVLGAPIRLYTVDHRLDPEHALAEADRLRREHRVDAYLDMVGSQVGIPMQAYAKEHGIAALQVGSASSTLTNEHCSPVGVHWAYDTHALAAGSTSAMIARGAETFYFLTVDYSFGHVLESDARQAIERNGGTVLGSTIHPFRATDFATPLLEAMASGADVIAFANAGDDLINSIREASELGILGSDTAVVALLAADDNVQNLGLYTAQGMIYTSGYYWAYDQQSREFAERFTKRYGGVPNMLQAATYSVTMHYLRAIEHAGTDEARAVVDAMKALPVNDFFARDGRVRADGRMVYDMYLVEAKPPQEQNERWAYLNVLEVIPGDQAYRPLEESVCDLVR